MPWMLFNSVFILSVRLSVIAFLSSSLNPPLIGILLPVTTAATTLYVPLLRTDINYVMLLVKGGGRGEAINSSLTNSSRG